MSNMRKKRNIYIAIVLICISSIGVLMYKYFIDNKKEYQERLKDTNEIVIDTQKKRIKEIVDRTINDIELEEKRVINTKEKEIEEISLLFDSFSQDLETEKIVNLV
ncbi:TPA: hypothetical protein KOT37_004024, partial [Clostridioides difficile]|nr:hypothetical protein [Clostridioides difficile]